MKLFRVTYEVEAVIAAEDFADAYAVAVSERRDVLSESGYYANIFVGNEVSAAGVMPEGWDGQSIPYGGDGNTRIAAYLKVDA